MPPEISDKELEEFKAAKARVEELQSKSASLESQLVEINKKLSSKDSSNDEGKEGSSEKDLNEKVRQSNREKDQQKAHAKSLEQAIRFNLSAKSFVDEYKDVLPKEASDILVMSEKESYDSDVERANATKAGLIKSFFDIAENHERLTASQKARIEDYLKLTPKAREERASDLFENVLEPALQINKQFLKAEQVARANAGYQTQSDVALAYKEKLMKHSENYYFGAKHAS